MCLVLYSMQARRLFFKHLHCKLLVATCNAYLLLAQYNNEKSRKNYFFEILGQSTRFVVRCKQSSLPLLLTTS